MSGKIMWINDYPKSYRADCSAKGKFKNALNKQDSGSDTLEIAKLTRIAKVQDAILFPAKDNIDSKNQIVLFFINMKGVLSSMIVRTEQSLQSFRNLVFDAHENGANLETSQIVCKMVEVTSGKHTGYHYIEFSLKKENGKVVETPAEFLEELKDIEKYNPANVYDLRIIQELINRNSDRVGVLEKNTSLLPSNHSIVPTNIIKALTQSSE